MKKFLVIIFAAISVSVVFSFICNDKNGRLYCGMPSGGIDYDMVLYGKLVMIVIDTFIWTVVFSTLFGIHSLFKYFIKNKKTI